MNEGLPQITTIIPTYRRPRLLRRAIRSVIGQTYPHFRVCVYDDVSGDETGEIVREMAKEDSRIDYQCHPKNIGSVENFAFGQERVRTPYFSFLSDDDVLLPDFYENALSGFQKHPEAVFSALGVALVNTHERIANVIPGDYWPEGLCLPPEGLRKMLVGPMFSWTGILFRKELNEKVGLVDPEVGYIHDVDYQLRIAAHHPFVVSHVPGALMEVHHESASVQFRMEKYWPGWLKMIRNLVDDNTLDPDLRNFTSQVLNKYLRHLLFVRWGLSAAVEGRGEDVQKAIEGLSRDLGAHGRAGFLRFWTAVHRVFPPLCHVSLGVLRLRREVKGRGRRESVERERACYQAYAGHLLEGI